MRNDVKFGLTIGGTLVALLAVWVILTDHGAKKTPDVIALAPSTMPSDVTQTSAPTPPIETSSATTQPAPVTETPPAILGSPANTETTSTAQDWSRLLQSGNTPAIGDRPATPPTMLAAEPTTQPAVAQAIGKHKIAPGESFYSIANAAYGDSKYFVRLEDANPNVNPNRLRVGMVIDVPGLQDAIPSRVKTSSAPLAANVDPATSYRVKASDTLIAIARRIYGDGQDWEKIYDANRDAIGPNPARLTVGMVLRLPATPKVAIAN
jgi:nucleoid-associated protein YgaU